MGLKNGWCQYSNFETVFYLSFKRAIDENVIIYQ